LTGEYVGGEDVSHSEAADVKRLGTTNLKVLIKFEIDSVFALTEGEESFLGLTA
jgi:hypothetical protein